VDAEDQPPAAAGAAMVELERRRLLPSFALSFFKPLSKAADPTKTPARLAWIGDDVMLLAPYRVGADHWGGFLIAEAEAAGQRRLLRSEDGETLEVMVPPSVASAGAVMAEEGSILPIA
jgi:hypothetical protein